DLPALGRAGRLPAASHGTTLLAPFDSLLWYRDRVSRVFGFDYRIEVYTPGPKRVHGYYTLPILHDGQLVGRLDAKAHRGEHHLEVRHVHLEPWAAQGQTPPRGGPALDRDGMQAGIAEAARPPAPFVDADRITVARVPPGRLRGPLARALREAERAPDEARPPGAAPPGLAWRPPERAASRAFSAPTRRAAASSCAARVGVASWHW